MASGRTWEAIKDLPDDGADSMRLRLRCCAPLGAWDLVEELTYLLGKGNPPDREAAAAFWLAMGRRDIENTETARACVVAAIKAWPGCRLEVLGGPILSGVVFPGGSPP